MSDYDSSDYIQLKQEPGISTPELSFADVEANTFQPTASSADFDSHYEDPQYSIAAQYEYERAIEAYGESAAVPDYYDQVPYTVAHDAQVYHPRDVSQSQIYHEATDHHSAASSVHAPRPVRCTSSPSFLSPEERIGAFATSFDSQGPQQSDAMLLHLATAGEATPQIALPQVPPMAPTEAPTEGNAVE